jgi:hypothetical protein
VESPAGKETKMIRRIVLFFVFYLLCFNHLTFAHPGDTDGSGGHTCRTNCGSWGLKYGEYHYHNGGYESLPSTTVPVQENYQSCYDTGYQEWKAKLKGDDLGAFSYYENNYALAFEEIKNKRFSTQDCANGYSFGMTAAINEPIQKATDSLNKEHATFGYRDGKNDFYKKLPYSPKGDIENAPEPAAYTEAYIKGWNEAKTKTEEEKKNKETEEALAASTQVDQNKNKAVTPVTDQKKDLTIIYNISVFFAGVIVALLAMRKRKGR